MVESVYSAPSSKQVCYCCPTFSFTAHEEKKTGKSETFDTVTPRKITVSEAGRAAHGKTPESRQTRVDETVESVSRGNAGTRETVSGEAIRDSSTGEQ